MEAIQNTEQFIFTREQLALILNVKNIRKIESRGKLEERLLQQGLKLIKKIKAGRSFEYIVENIKKLSTVDLCRKYKINKVSEFKIHTKNRYESINGDNDLITKSDFADASNTSIYQVNKFDNTLLSEDFMKKDGFIYLAYKDGKCIGQVPVENYNRYWLEHGSYKKELESLHKRKANNELTDGEYDLLVTTLYDKLNRKGEIIHKIRKFNKGSAFEELYNNINNL